MKRNLLAKAGLIVALTMTTLYVGCCINIDNNFRAKAQRLEEMDAPVAGVATLDVTTCVGTVKFEAAETDQVHIVADITVKAKTEEQAQALLEEVRIEARTSGEKLVIKPVKPAGFDRNKLLVDFAITAPENLAIQCQTNVGDVKTVGFAGPVTAKTDVGSITCENLRHKASLRTNVGNITAVYCPDAPPVLNLTAVTNVGDIELAGPDHISATLSAGVNVGSINTDRPLTVTGQIKKSLKATLGQAEGTTRLTTNVGSIKIR